MKKLYKEAYAETNKMKEIVHKIVPTYFIRPEDRIIDKKIEQEWKEDFTDTGTELPEAFQNIAEMDK